MNLLTAAPELLRATRPWLRPGAAWGTSAPMQGVPTENEPPASSQADHEEVPVLVRSNPNHLAGNGGISEALNNDALRRSGRSRCLAAGAPASP